MLLGRLARALPRLRVAAVATASGATVLYASSPTQCLFGAGPKADWDKIKAEIIALCDDDGAANPSVDNAPGSLGGGGYVAPMLVRLAWHSCGSYGKKANDGGSDGGTIRFCPEINHGGNAGLKHAIGCLAPIKENNPGASWADLIVYAGVVAIENMGGPSAGFTPGRTDAPSPGTAPTKDKRFTPDDRLPDAAQGAQHLRDVFYRMGFNDQEIVALSGAHAIGRCHTDRSGFWGPWTYGEAAFSNDYYKFLLEKKWTVKKTHEARATGTRLPCARPSIAALTRASLLLNSRAGGAVEGAEAVRGRRWEADDAADRHGADRGPKLQEVGQDLRRVGGGLLCRLCQGVPQAHRARLQGVSAVSPPSGADSPTPHLNSNISIL